MADEICGYLTPKGPCTMRKGHETLWHRHRDYDAISWRIKNTAGKVLAYGEGINPLTYAISRNRVKGDKLLIELEC